MRPMAGCLPKQIDSNTAGVMEVTRLDHSEFRLVVRLEDILTMIPAPN
jgi:hypothetical protein